MDQSANWILQKSRVTQVRVLCASFENKKKRKKEIRRRREASVIEGGEGDGEDLGTV